MRIAKYGHSCLLVEAASGKRILVDPGVYSVIPDEVIGGPLDAVLITHSHPDHCGEEFLTKISTAHPGIAIYATTDIMASMVLKGIKITDHNMANIEIGETKIEVLEAGHEAILGVAPRNTAYRIDGELVITGDSGSLALDVWAGSHALALPLIAPWTTEVIQAAFLTRMKPAVAFGVHDGFVIEVYRSKLETRFEKVGAEHGIKYINATPELLQI